MLAVTMEAYGDADDDVPEELDGVTMPATLAMLGVCFAGCTILLAGLPPLSGFIAKFGILSAIIGTGSIGVPPTGPALALAALIIIAGLATLIALTRAGIRTFWSSLDVAVPRVLVVEVAPVLALLALLAALTIQAGPALSYMEAAVRSTGKGGSYLNGVMEEKALPSWRDLQPQASGD